MPKAFETADRSSTAGESDKHALHIEYVIIQSTKSVSIWNKSPIPIIL